MEWVQASIDLGLTTNDGAELVGKFIEWGWARFDSERDWFEVIRTSFGVIGENERCDDNEEDVVEKTARHACQS